MGGNRRKPVFWVSAVEGRAFLQRSHIANTWEANSKKAALERAAFVRFGGNGGIRTHGGFAPSADFESAAFSLSATFP